MKSIYVCECGSQNLLVKDSRHKDNSILRRRKCLNCGRIIKSYEMHSDDYNELLSRRDESVVDLVVSTLKIKCESCPLRSGCYAITNKECRTRLDEYFVKEIKNSRGITK